MKRRTLAMGWELMEIESAVAAARILVDGIRFHQFASEHDAKRAPDAAAAALTLVELRVRHLWHVVQGVANPSEIWAHHNASTTTSADDIYLVEWTDARVMREADAALAHVAAPERSCARLDGDSGAVRRMG